MAEPEPEHGHEPEPEHEHGPEHEHELDPEHAPELELEQELSDAVAVAAAVVVELAPVPVHGTVFVYVIFARPAAEMMTYAKI